MGEFLVYKNKGVFIFVFCVLFVVVGFLDDFLVKVAGLMECDSIIVLNGIFILFFIFFVEEIKFYKGEMVIVIVICDGQMKDISMKMMFVGKIGVVFVDFIYFFGFEW